MKEKLRPKIEKNKIINLNDILESIKTCEDKEFLTSYHNESLMYKQGTYIEGLKELSDTLSDRIKKLNKIETNNVNILKNLKEKNPNLSKLEIIETKKDINDSKQDIDYLSYLNEEGNIKLIECNSSQILSDLLSENPNELLSGTPEDIFNYLNFYKYREMKFIKASKFLEHHPILNEEVIIFYQELNEIEKYSKRNNIFIELEVAVNSHDERLYKLGTLIIKFYNDKIQRKMVIINDELKNKELINLIHIIPEEHNLTEINNIIVKLHDNYYITNEEQQKLYSFINNGLEKIAQYELEYNDCRNTIDFYIVYLEKKLMDKQLSKEEERILKKYQNIIRERETKLLNPDSDTNNSSKP